MSNETKNAESKAQTVQADKVAATYIATEKSLADLETKAANARREIREQSDVYARAQEERQRSAEQWNYEEEQRRRKVRDEQAIEDRERARVHAEASERIALRDKSVRETAAKLFGVSSDPFDPEQAKANLDKKLTEAENRGKAIAKTEAEKDYTTRKAIDEANVAKDLALLRAENERLKSDNAKLESENKRLSDINTNLATRTGDLALGAFNASAGIQSKATESLQAAAQSGQRTNPR